MSSNKVIKFKKGELDALIKESLLGLKTMTINEGVAQAIAEASSIGEKEAEKKIFDAIKELYLSPTKQPKVQGKGIQLNSGHTLEAVLRTSLEYLYYVNHSNPNEKIAYIQKALANTKRDNLSALVGGDIEIQKGDRIAKIQVKSAGASLAIYRPIHNFAQATDGKIDDAAINFLRNPKTETEIESRFLDNALDTYLSMSAANLYMVGLTSSSGVKVGQYTTWNKEGKESTKDLTFGKLISMMVAIQLSPSQFKEGIKKFPGILKLETGSSSNSVKNQNPKNAAALFEAVMDSKIARNPHPDAKRILAEVKQLDGEILNGLTKIANVSQLSKDKTPELAFMKLYDKILNAKIRFNPNVKYSQEMITRAASASNGNYVLHAPSGRLLYLSLSAIVNSRTVNQYFNRWREPNKEIFDPLFGQFVDR